MSDCRQHATGAAATMSAMTTAIGTTFRVQALPAKELARIRATGSDDFGHPVRVSVVEEEPGTPLRCCLREAHAGERVALISWRPLREAPDSVYAEVGPVFVHADDCPGYDEEGSYPEGFRRRVQVLRTYSATGDMLDAVMTEGSAAEEAIAGLFTNPDAVVVHSRNVKAGCYMFAVYKAEETGR
jgi:hypothetical protein